MAAVRLAQTDTTIMARQSMHERWHDTARMKQTQPEWSCTAICDINTTAPAETARTDSSKREPLESHRRTERQVPTFKDDAHKSGSGPKDSWSCAVIGQTLLRTGLWGCGTRGLLIWLLQDIQACVSPAGVTNSAALNRHAWNGTRRPQTPSLGTKLTVRLEPTRTQHATEPYSLLLVIWPLRFLDHPSVSWSLLWGFFGCSWALLDLKATTSSA